MERPLLLITNDDGVHAAGIAALARAVSPLGDVVVLAPESEQSTTSHSLSLTRPLRLRALRPGWFALDGTPADCTYVALHHPAVLSRRPTMVLSGINHGSNLGTDVFYSGTVAAAREAALRGIPAMAFSMPSEGEADAWAPLVAALAESLLREVTARPPTRGLLLNVNFPSGAAKGVRATGVGVREYENLVEVRADPRGRQYLWIGGPSVMREHVPGSDTESFEQGYVTVTRLALELGADDPEGYARALRDVGAARVAAMDPLKE